MIFDCDGVLVDSELITNQVFLEMLGEIGAFFTLEELFEQFLGHSTAYCMGIVRERLGREVPAGFVDEYRERTARALREQLRPVPGIREVLTALTLPVCVASSGEPEKIRLTLGLTGLLAHFEGRLYSASAVAHSKPAPDVFLYAAVQMGAAPARTAVVEDTPVGVTAGRAAGMTVFGYAARTPSHRLEAAGATLVFCDMRELPDLLARV